MQKDPQKINIVFLTQKNFVGQEAVGYIQNAYCQWRIIYMAKLSFQSEG